MERILLRHLSGSKAGRVEEFSPSQFGEIVIGRDLASDVSFADTDVMVGRQHLKLTRSATAPAQFFVTDLNSRNGTYVNGHRLSGMTVINPGDVLQCGTGGPELRFEYQPGANESVTRDASPAATMPLGVPRSPNAVSSTPNFSAGHPLAHVSHTQNSPTPRQAAAPPHLPQLPAQAVSGQASPAQQPVSPPNKPSSNRSWTPWLLGSGLGLVLVTLGASFWLYRSYTAPAKPGANDAGKNGAVPSGAIPDNGSKYGHLHLSGADTSEAEKDQQRTAWRIEVAPYLALGSGHPGKAASDFDKPDGVGFSPNGLLYATDAGNHRVQVWNVKTGERLGEFGHGIFGGEIVDIAVAPNGSVYVTDQSLNLAYVFEPPMPGELDEKGKPLGPYDYHFKGTRFGEQGFKKLGGIAIDSKGRIYVVDAHRNDVRRFNPDNTLDKSFKFEHQRADGDTYLHGCEGIAIDEAADNLFIASEKDAVIEVFDWESGAYKHRFVGASPDPADKPAGKHVFFGSVEGLSLAQNHLLAVDESAGHIQVFDLSRADAFNTDLAGYAAPQPQRSSGYQGFFGHAPQVDFEDKTNLELQKQVKTGAILPGQANVPGYFCSPDSIATYQDAATGETYIAIADQCNYRLVVYRWSDIGKAIGVEVAVREAAPENKAASEKLLAQAKTVNAPAPAPSVRPVAAPGKSNGLVRQLAPVRRRPAPARVGVLDMAAKNVLNKPIEPGGKKKKKKHAY